MAITGVTTVNEVIGTIRFGVVEITMDSSHASGGEAFDFKAKLGWASLTAVLSLQISTADGYVPQWDSANGLLLLFEAGADGAVLDEVTSGDMSGVTITATVIGI